MKYLAILPSLLLVEVIDAIANAMLVTQEGNKKTPLAKKRGIHL
jgi:hypothetical protein